MLYGRAPDERRRSLRLVAVQPRRHLVPQPFHHAVTLPALPTGMQSTSGASPSSSHTSKAPVFWPSMRRSLTEHERDRMLPCQLADERQRLVEVAAQGDHARAVHERWASLPVAILPSGTITAPRSPARAA